MLKIGLIREGKVPVDRRVVLLPEQCKELQHLFKGTEIYVQSSVVRCVRDEAYEQAGFKILENLDHCDILLGVKEVPIKDLIPEKTYFFFSHTIKKQPKNRNLLKNILQKKIRLIDFECLTNHEGERLIAFGRYAGIVGAYNAFWAYGNRYKTYELHRAIDLGSYENLMLELKKVKLPPSTKIAITGRGRAGKGAVEILSALNIKKVTPEEYLSVEFTEPVYVHLASSDYYTPIATEKEANFYKQPHLFSADFLKFTSKTDIFISTHFWDTQADPLFSKEDMKIPEFRIKIIADVTCDVEGSIPSTIRTSSIPDPIYDFNPFTQEEERPFLNDSSITVMAVDNLPCELPIEASHSFGEQFIQQVMPHFFNNDVHEVLKKATITQSGQLTSRFDYLKSYVEG